MTPDTEGRVDRFQTTIELERDGDQWTATEPAAQRDVIGRGPDPRDAVQDYMEALR